MTRLVSPIPVPGRPRRPNRPQEKDKPTRPKDMNCPECHASWPLVVKCRSGFVRLVKTRADIIAGNGVESVCPECGLVLHSPNLDATPQERFLASIDLEALQRESALDRFGGFIHRAIGHQTRFPEGFIVPQLTKRQRTLIDSFSEAREELCRMNVTDLATRALVYGNVELATKIGWRRFRSVPRECLVRALVHVTLAHHGMEHDIAITELEQKVRDSIEKRIFKE